MATVYTNQPSGSTILYDCAFAGSQCNGQNGAIWKNYYNTSAYATLSLPGGGSGQVFDSFVGVGSNEGNGQWILELPRVRDIYYGVWWQTNSDFVGYSNNTNKMLFTFSAGEDNNFLVWQGLPGASKTIKYYGQMAYANNHLTNTFGMNYPTDGTGWFNPNQGVSGTVAPASGWHFIELYLKCSTSTTSKDGVVRWWLNSQMVGNFTSVNLSPSGLSDFQINHAWDGGARGDLTKAWHHYFSDLRVTTGGTVGSGGSNPGGGEVPPPEPAPQVVLQDLTPANTSVTVAGTRQFTISMSGPMATGTSLFTTSSNTAVATVPASVAISQGSSTAVFSATGVSTGSTTISTNYNGVTKGATLQVQAAPTTGATTTYTYLTDFSGTQGPNWYYLEEGGTQMTYNGGGAVWVGSDAFLIQTIWSSGFHPGRFAGAKVRFVCPNGGSARITGAYYDVDTGGGVGAVAKVNHNGSTLFQRTIANGDTTGGAYDVTVTVAAGDFLEFLVVNQTGDYSYNSTNLDPVIALSITSTVPNPPPPPDPPASVVDLFTATQTIIKDIPFTLTVRLSRIVTVDTAVEIRAGSSSLVTVATSVTVPSGSNEKSFTVTPIQVGNVAIDAILTTTKRFNASIQPNPADIPPVIEPDIPPITAENPLTVDRLVISLDGANVTLNRPANALAFKYDAQPEWKVIAAFADGGAGMVHRFTWPSGTTTICYRAQDGDGNWGPSACAPFTPPAPPPPPPAVNKAVRDKDGINWQLTGKASPYILKRNGESMDNTYGITLRKSGDGYMEILQTNGVWLRRNGNAWEFVA